MPVPKPATAFLLRRALEAWKEVEPRRQSEERMHRLALGHCALSRLGNCVAAWGRHTQVSRQQRCAREAKRRAAEDDERAIDEAIRQAQRESSQSSSFGGVADAIDAEDDDADIPVPVVPRRHVDSLPPGRGQGRGETTQQVPRHHVDSLPRGSGQGCGESVLQVPRHHVLSLPIGCGQGCGDSPGVGVGSEAGALRSCGSRDTTWTRCPFGEGRGVGTARTGEGSARRHVAPPVLLACGPPRPPEAGGGSGGGNGKVGENAKEAKEATLAAAAKPKALPKALRHLIPEPTEDRVSTRTAADEDGRSGTGNRRGGRRPSMLRKVAWRSGHWA